MMPWNRLTGGITEVIVVRSTGIEDGRLSTDSPKLIQPARL
jgi:hypothetical protein